MPQRRTEIGFGLGLLLAGLLGFAVVEWLAQARERRIAAKAVNWAALADQAAGASVSGMMLFRPGARYGALTFNAQGFRGPEIPVPAPDDRIRIAFLGDSKVFAADLAEADTLSAQTVARLEALKPGCRFDYVTIAGPGYTLPLLARLLADRRPQLEPDAVVLLAGSVTDLVDPPSAARGSSAEAVGATMFRGPGSFGPLLEQSRALQLAERELTMLSPATPDSSAASQPVDLLRRRFVGMLEQLDQAIAGLPTVAVAYRSREIDAEAPGAQFLAARRIRQTLPGIGVEKAKALTEMVVDEMHRHARQAGWHAIDPIAKIQSDGRHFVDRTHFSPLGHARIADATSKALAEMIRPDCSMTGDDKTT